MKESYRKGIANHPDPESCQGSREVSLRSVDRGTSRPGIELRNHPFGVPTLSSEAEGHTLRSVQGELFGDPAQSDETPSMFGNSVRENREIPVAPAASSGPAGEGSSRKSSMNATGESDGGIVPTKHPNKGGEPPAEGVEGRPPAKENTGRPTTCRTQSRASVSPGLTRVREAAQRGKGEGINEQFTTLLHHLTEDLLWKSYYSLKQEAAPGVDEVTWQEYGIGLEQRLHELWEKVHRGSYRAQPSLRVYKEKPDGRQRPLGIAALEDKVVQRAVVYILETIYEEEFLGFSYGFRPSRDAHRALDALSVALERKKVNWVLDADIRGFFDNIDHECLCRLIEQRVGDRRMLRLIQKWLKAGVSEEGVWSETKVGTPQGAVISPLLANIYLHYVLDAWVQQWREEKAEGDVILVRYADDFVVGFQHRAEAERFLEQLRERMREFGLELHPDKTRLIEFGRFAEENRKRRGGGKPDTFDFLGFTHRCGKTRTHGWFTVLRETVTKRMRATLQRVKQELRRRRHRPFPETAAWLASVVRGYFQYHAVPGNMRRIKAFHREVRDYWLRVLRRRSQKHRMTWERYARLFERWIPRPRILQPYPNVRFDAIHQIQGKSRMR